MVKVFIEGEPYEVNGSQNLLHNCLSLGFNLPYFCWHPALGSVGACRQCAVKQFHDEKDTQGKIVMACMTPSVEGTRISINDPEAVQFRASIIEGLMMNHPHDCPVCDEGGECHLQDMTVMTGHDYRRYIFPKRTFRNQYLGPFLNHEMNRCIQCYRCVRFYRDYAGGHDFNVFKLRNIAFFGRHEDGVLENEFAGNLVEVCPTGVFTDKTLKEHYTRKWDLQMAPSICVHCGVGCNITPGERYGLLRRIVNRYNGQVNGYFLCDRGRYGYEFVNSSLRIREPLARVNGTLAPVSKDAALEQCRQALRDTGKVIGIGSVRASLESNFVLRSLVDPDGFIIGTSDHESRMVSEIIEILKNTPAHSASLSDVESSDAVLILGEDLTNTAPRLALSVRQSVRQESKQIAARLGISLWLDQAVREAGQEEYSPLFVLSPHETRLDDIAVETHLAVPDEIARLGFSIAHALDPNAAAPSNVSASHQQLAERIAAALKNAARPLIVSGVSLHNESILRAAANIALALGRKGREPLLNFVVPECNSFGLGLLGGQPLSAAFAAIKKGEVDTLIILENDLYRDAEKAQVDEILAHVRHVIVLDHLVTPTTENAEVVLPAATFAEGDGTLVSSEGRAQRFFQVFKPERLIQESWRWLEELELVTSSSTKVHRRTVDELTETISNAIPGLSRLREVAPSSAFRMAGTKIPREPHRYSGRTAMRAHISVHEPKPPEDPETPFSFTMEGNPNQPPSPLIPFFWSPGWNSIQSVNKFQEEIAGPLQGGDPGIKLIEPGTDTTMAYFSEFPDSFAGRDGEWLLLPVYHIFGTEELSAKAPAVAELIPRRYIALNPGDAERLQVNDSQEVEVSVNHSTWRLPVRLRPDLMKGTAGIPIGIPSMGFVLLPTWGRISRAG